MTQTDEDAVIARLKVDAKAGNVQAARELREWLKAKQERDQGASSIDTATTYTQLNQAQRLELRARLLREALAADAQTKGIATRPFRLASEVDREPE